MIKILTESDDRKLLGGKYVQKPYRNAGPGDEIIQRSGEHSEPGKIYYYATFNAKNGKWSMMRDYPRPSEPERIKAQDPEDVASYLDSVENNPDFKPKKTLPRYDPNYGYNSWGGYSSSGKK